MSDYDELAEDRPDDKTATPRDRGRLAIQDLYRAARQWRRRKLETRREIRPERLQGDRE